MEVNLRCITPVVVVLISGNQAYLNQANLISSSLSCCLRAYAILITYGVKPFALLITHSECVCVCGHLFECSLRMERL